MTSGWSTPAILVRACALQKLLFARKDERGLMSESESEGDLIDLLDQVIQPSALDTLLESVETIHQIEAEFESKLGTQDDTEQTSECDMYVWYSTS